MTTTELVANFEGWATQNLAPGSVEQYRRHFRRFLAAAGDIELSEVKPHHLTSWARRWHEFQALQRLFNFARDWLEVITKNPFGKLRLPPLGQRKRVLTPRQMAKALRAARHDFRAYLLALRETLGRPQEVRAFAWEQVQTQAPGTDWPAAVLDGHAFFVLDDYKSRTRRNDPNSKRVIPITPRLGRLLVRLAVRAPGRHGCIFQSVAGRPWSKEAIRLRWKRLRKALGLGDADHRGERIVCYTFRHSVATLATALGVKDRTLADLMGHTTTRTTARYQHLDAPHLSEAARNISAFVRRGRRPKK